MKIVLLNTFDIFGGAARSMWRLHKGLRAIGVESTVLCLRKNSKDEFTEALALDSSIEAERTRQEWVAVQQTVNANLAKQHCTFFSLPVPGYDLSLHPVVRDADVIHLHWVAGMLSPESVAALLALGKPVVWTLHDMRAFTGGCHFSDGCQRFESDCGECPQLKPDFNHLAEFNLGNLLKTVDASGITVVTPSRWLGDCARASRFFGKSRVEVVPYGLETDVYHRLERRAALEAFGLESGPMSFLFGADNILEPRKGVKTLVGAMQACAGDAKFGAAIQSGEVRFLSFGMNGGAFGNLPWVKNLGRISGDEKMCAAYSAADVFLCPTLEDNLPNTILESMSCGTPSIASRVGGVPDMITDGVDGWMFPRGDASALAKRILSAFKDREVLKKAGNAARQAIEERFGLELQAKRYAELYSGLLADGGKRVMPKAPEAVLENGVETASVNGGDFFGTEELANIKALAEAFQKNPINRESGDALRNLRIGLADHLLGADEASLQGLFAKDYGEVYGLIVGAGLIDSARAPEEEKIAQAVRSYFENLGEGKLDTRFLLVAMIFFRAHEIGAWPAVNAVPEWLEERYFDFLFHAPEIFFRIGEAEEYLAHMRRQYAALRGLLLKQPTSRFARKFLPKFLNKSNVIPLYFNEDPLKDIMEVRAELSALALRSMGAILDHKFSKRAAGSKIRIGVLDASVAPRSETYVTLPALRLDRKKFSVQLLSLSPALSPELEGACRKMVDTITVLPREVVKQVTAIRDLDLDVLLIGSNTCAVSNGQFLLSLHRLARLQLVSYCSPVTSGNKNVDAFLSGTLACVPDAQEQFAERLLQIPGPPGCMDYDHDRKPAVRGFTKSDFGIPEDAILFVSGANCFKILPEMQEVWAEILEKVPGSRLLLHPFNPNWTNKYPELRFQESFFKTLSRRGIDLDRLVVSTHKLPTRSDVVAMMSIGDVYLDTFPYSGSISLTDPLETGVPTLVCEDKSLRSRQGAALLRDIGMEELVTTNADEYITKAIELSNDLHKRNEVRAKIQAAVAAKPRYLDPKRYGRQLGRMLEKIVREGLDAWNPEEAERDEQRELSTPTVEPKSSAFQPISATLEEAVSAFTEGRLSDAEDICREVLGKDERCAGAWHLMGKMAALQGDLETAGEFASVACELEAQNAEFVRELAEVFLRKKELDLAEQQVRRALEMAPDSPEGLVLLGRILAEKDDKSASLEAFQDALRLRKDYAEGFSHYATALQKFGRGKDAISQIRKACALEPDSVEFQTNLAILLEQNARYVDALAAYGKAARMNPNVGFVWFRQGKLLNGLKRYAESIPALAKAISLPGELGDYHYEYGLALHMSKRFQEALVHYEKALSMGYNTAALQCNRGVIYKDLRKGGDAIMAFHAAVKMDPSNVSYLNNLGAAALELGLNTEALECFEQAVEKNPKLPTARNNIGNLLKDRARGMDALPQYRKSMELNPDDRDAPSNYLLCHMYIPDMDPKLVFEEHKKWGISTTKKFPPAFKFKPREAGAKIRVGFLSADLCHHPVAHFIEPIFRGYDRERFEVVAYGDQRKSDEFSARFAKQVDLWRETSRYDDRALAKLIHEDRVDILFELAGHTAYNRLGVFALKPAPVQVSYLGYPGTTGLQTIDFRITDAFGDPRGTTEHLHTEKLIRVPECAWCFEPDASAPEVEPLPALKNGYVTFGCFNNMAKLNPSLFETWAEILLRVPGSHLRLKARTLTDDGVRKELKSYFTERGIEEDRLDFFGHTKKIADHLSHYHSVDIALDSFPYHGTTTTCEAMWMGCPVVTRAGKTHVSRVGVSLLSAVGLQEFITDTREAYIEKAVALAAQTDRLQEIRAGMRERLRQSVLMDEKRFVQGFETALMEMANLGRPILSI